MERMRHPLRGAGVRGDQAGDGADSQGIAPVPVCAVRADLLGVRARQDDILVLWSGLHTEMRASADVSRWEP